MLMDSTRNNEGRQRKPRIVEVIGPAGAGKTTLCSVLSRSGSGIRLGNFPDVRKAANALFFISYGSRLIPTLIDISQYHDGRLSRQEFAWLTILSGWSNILQKELKKNSDIILLDQGPVYLLTEISEFGPESLKRKPAGKRLWRDLHSRWSNVLDVVVWLDAADVYLAERIHSREKGHPVKDRSIETTLEFLACYRRAYERTISRLLANHSGLKILWFDTSRTSPQEIASQLLLEFGCA